MNDALSTYLNDHLAGAAFAIELLEHLRDTRENTALGTFAAYLLEEVVADRDILQGLRDQIGGNSLLKETVGRLAEGATWLKLRLSSDTDFGEFETLEILSLGVVGKQKLWSALAEIAPLVPQLGDLNFERLMRRAQDQHDQLDAFRISAAKKALTCAPSTRHE
jgi:hypothetical protein